MAGKRDSRYSPFCESREAPSCERTCPSATDPGTCVRSNLRSEWTVWNKREAINYLQHTTYTNTQAEKSGENNKITRQQNVVIMRQARLTNSSSSWHLLVQLDRVDTSLAWARKTRRLCARRACVQLKGDDWSWFCCLFTFDDEVPWVSSRHGWTSRARS